MAAFSRGSSRANVVRSPKRSSFWNEGPGGITAQAFTASTTIVLGLGQTPLIPGLTIVRTRGFLEIVLEAASAIGEGMAGAFGIGIVSTDAFGVGVTALPAPIDDQEWGGWLFHQHWSIHATTATISDGVNTGRIAFDVDSKAMRKFGLNEVLFASMQTTEIGTSQLEVFFNSRLLVKAP